jgi:uncharacterized protein
MKSVATLIFACVLAVFVAPLRAEDAKPAPDPARIAAARDLMEVTGVIKNLDSMMDAMKQSFAKGAKADTSETGKKLTDEFEAGLKRLLSYKEDMITDFAALYAETFTAEEMKTVADFYRSGTGAKFIELTPGLMQKGAAIGMKYSERIMNEMKPTAPAAPK